MVGVCLCSGSQYEQAQVKPLHMLQLFVHLQGNHRAKQSQASPVTDKPAPPVTSSAKTILTLETAMSLYGLTESESFWEVKQDTRCLVSWGGTRVVVAFRGTASMKNALADLQVRLQAHCLIRMPQCRGRLPCTAADQTLWLPPSHFHPLDLSKCACHS